MLLLVCQPRSPKSVLQFSEIPMPPFYKREPKGLLHGFASYIYCDYTNNNM